MTGAVPVFRTLRPGMTGEDVTLRIADRPARVRIFDAAGVCRSETRLVYDRWQTANTYTDKPNKGLLSERDQALTACSEAATLAVTAGSAKPVPIMLSRVTKWARAASSRRGDCCSKRSTACVASTGKKRWRTARFHGQKRGRGSWLWSQR